MNSDCDNNINSSSRYHPSEFCTKLNYVYTTRQCDEYFEYLAELRKIIFGHNYPENMLAGTSLNSNSIHYHTNSGRTLVYQVDDVSEYGIKLSSAQVSARTETLITDTYYAEEHVLSRPETSEIVTPKLCHQLPSIIEKPMGNCVHPSSKIEVFPDTKGIHEKAKMHCKESVSYSYLPTIEKGQKDYDHYFYNYESNFNDAGSMNDVVDESFAVNEEFSNVLEETDSVFEEQGDDTIEDTCSISDDKVHRIVGIVTRHSDTKSSSNSSQNDNEFVEESSSKTPTEHSFHAEPQNPGISSYDRFVFDTADHDFSIKTDFQLPSIFSNRSKTSSLGNLKQASSNHASIQPPITNFVSTSTPDLNEKTLITSSVDILSEPKTPENSVLVNMAKSFQSPSIFSNRSKTSSVESLKPAISNLASNLDPTAISVLTATADPEGKTPNSADVSQNYNSTTSEPESLEDSVSVNMTGNYQLPSIFSSRSKISSVENRRPAILAPTTNFVSTPTPDLEEKTLITPSVDISKDGNSRTSEPETLEKCTFVNMTERFQLPSVFSNRSETSPVEHFGPESSNYASIPAPTTNLDSTSEPDPEENTLIISQNDSSTISEPEILENSVLINRTESFQLPSIFNPKTSSAENLKHEDRNLDTTIDSFPTSFPGSEEVTSNSSSVSISQDINSTTPEPETPGNSVLVNMIEDYVKMVMEASRELNQSTSGETPQENSSGFPSSSYLSAANIPDSTTNGNKLNSIDRKENETYQRDTGKQEIKNEGIESGKNKNHENSVALTESSNPEIESSDEESDSYSVNTMIEVLERSQEPELESPVVERGGFLPVAPRKSSVEEWKSETLRSELGNSNQEEKKQFFRDSELEVNELNYQEVGVSENDSPTENEQCETIVLESCLNLGIDEKETTQHGIVNSFPLHESANCEPSNNEDSEDSEKQFMEIIPLSHSTELEETFSEAVNIKHVDSELQSDWDQETENEPIIEPEGIPSTVSEGHKEMKKSEDANSKFSGDELSDFSTEIGESVSNFNIGSGDIPENPCVHQDVDELVNSIPTGSTNTLEEEPLENNSSNEFATICEDVLSAVERLLDTVSEANQESMNSSNGTTTSQSGSLSILNTEFPVSTEQEAGFLDYEVKSCMDQIIEICLEMDNADHEAQSEDEIQAKNDEVDEAESVESATEDVEKSQTSESPSSSNIVNSKFFRDSSTILDNLPVVSCDKNVDLTTKPREMIFQSETSPLENSNASYQESEETKGSNEQSIVTQLEMASTDKQDNARQENDFELRTESVVENKSGVDVGQEDGFQSENVAGRISTNDTSSISEVALIEFLPTSSYQQIGGSSIGDEISSIDMIYCEPEEQNVLESKSQKKTEASFLPESNESLRGKTEAFLESGDIGLTNNGSRLDEHYQNHVESELLDEAEQEMQFNTVIENLLKDVISKLEENTISFDQLLSNHELEPKIVPQELKSATIEIVDYSNDATDVLLLENVIEVVVQEDTFISVNPVASTCAEDSSFEIVSNVVIDLLNTVGMEEDISEVLENLIEELADWRDQEDTIGGIEATLSAVFAKNFEPKQEDEDVMAIVNFLLNTCEKTCKDEVLEGSFVNNSEKMEQIVPSKSSVSNEENSGIVAELVEKLLVSVSQTIEESDVPDELSLSPASHNELEDNLDMVENSLEQPEEFGSHAVVVLQTDNLSKHEEDSQNCSIEELVSNLLERVSLSSNDSNDTHVLLSDIPNVEEIPSEKDNKKAYQEDISDVLEEMLIAVSQLSFDEEHQRNFEDENETCDGDVVFTIRSLMEKVCSEAEKQEAEIGLIEEREDSEVTSQGMTKKNHNTHEVVDNDEQMVKVIEELMGNVLNHLDFEEKDSFANNQTSASIDPISSLVDSELSRTEQNEFCSDEVKGCVEQILQNICSDMETDNQELLSEGNHDFEEVASSTGGVDLSLSDDDDDDFSHTETTHANYHEVNESTIIDASPEIQTILQNIIEDLLQSDMRWADVVQEIEDDNEEILDVLENTESEVLEDSGFCDDSVLEQDSLDVSHLCSKLVENAPDFVIFDERVGEEDELLLPEENDGGENSNSTNCEDGLEFSTQNEEKFEIEGDHQVEREKNMPESEYSAGMPNLDTTSHIEFENENQDFDDEPLLSAQTMEDVTKLEEGDCLADQDDEHILEQKNCLERGEDDVLSDLSQESKNLCLDYNSNGIQTTCENAESCPTRICDVDSTTIDSNLDEATSCVSKFVGSVAKSKMDIAELISRYAEDLVRNEFRLALSDAVELISGKYTEQVMAPDTYSPDDTQLKPDRFNDPTELSFLMTPDQTILNADVENMDETIGNFSENEFDLPREDISFEDAVKGNQILEPRCKGTINKTFDVVVASLETVGKAENPLRTHLEETQNTLVVDNKFSEGDIECTPTFDQISTETAFENIEVYASDIKDAPQETPGLPFTENSNIQNGPPAIEHHEELDCETPIFGELPSKSQISHDSKDSLLENCVTSRNAPSTPSDTKHDVNVTTETANVLHHMSNDISSQSGTSMSEILDDCDDTSGSKIKHLNEAETSKHEDTECSTPPPVFGTEQLILSMDVTHHNAPNLHPECSKSTVHDDIGENVPTNSSLKLPVETSSTESSLTSLEQPSTSLVLKEVSHFLTTACVVALAFMSPSESTSPSFNPDIIEDASKYLSEEDGNDADKN